MYEPLLLALMALALLRRMCDDPLVVHGRKETSRVRI